MRPRRFSIARSPMAAIEGVKGTAEQRARREHRRASASSAHDRDRASHGGVFEPVPNRGRDDGRGARRCDQSTMSRAARIEPASHARNSIGGSGSIVSGAHAIGMGNGRNGSSRT